MWLRGDSSSRNDDPEHEASARGPFGRWLRWFVLGFVALLAASLAVWVLTGPPPRSPPVIAGPNVPDRRAPDDQTRLVPNQDQPIYESVAPGRETNRGEDLLAEPERPLDRTGIADQIREQDSQQAGGPDRVAAGDRIGDPMPDPAAPSAGPAAPSEQAPPGQPDALPQPGGPEQQAASPPQTEPSALRPDTTGQPVPPRPPDSQTTASTGDAATSTGETAAATGDAATSESEAEPPASEQYHIQIASVRTEEQAAAEWQRVASRHPDLLGLLDPRYVRFETQNGGIYYRVQGGPLVDEELAKLLCAQLKPRGVPCLVISP